MNKLFFDSGNDRGGGEQPDIFDHIDSIPADPRNTPSHPSDKEGIEQIKKQFFDAGLMAERIIWKDEVEKLTESIKQKDEEIAKLSQWKAEAMQVMGEVNFGEVAKLLKVKLGESISAAILPGIASLQQELEKVKGECISLHEIRETITDMMAETPTKIVVAEFCADLLTNLKASKEGNS